MQQIRYVIRWCTRADLPSIIGLCAEHAAFERASYDPTGKLVKLERAIFADPPRLYCRVVEVDSEVIGYATYTFDFSTWDASVFLYLDCLYLKSKFRGEGIGEEIMRTIITIAQESTCVNVQWQTPEFNVRAMKFYRRIGGVGQRKMRFLIGLH